MLNDVILIGLFGRSHHANAEFVVALIFLILSTLSTAVPVGTHKCGSLLRTCAGFTGNPLTTLEMSSIKTNN